MKKCVAIVTYDEITNHVYNITVSTEDGRCSNLTPDKMRLPNNFQKCYKMVLQILKNNNYTVEKFNSFDATWYNILWVGNNHVSERFAYFGEEI